MKKITLAVFLLTCLLQWFIPAQMIWQQEQLRLDGTTFKLRTIPVDPNDPFRGKYITLNYAISRYTTSNLPLPEGQEIDKTAYVILSNDDDGFAQIERISFTPPTSTTHYLLANVLSHSEKDGVFSFQLEYPFQTFFMEENKAPKAEAVYRDFLQDTDNQVYGEVNVDKGNATLIDVKINGVSINEYVE